MRRQRAAWHRHRAMRRLALPLTLISVLFFWQMLVMIGGYAPFTLPSPLLVLERFIAAVRSGVLLGHLVITLTEALAGFALALVVGLVLGYILAHTRWLEQALAPLLAASQAVPIIAIAPLIILWFGTGIQAKILVAGIITFFPVLMSTIVALRSIPRELREMALISGANRWQMVRYIELPLSLPVLFGGIRTGLALATTGAVVGEFVAGRDGLGALINIARGLFDTPLMFVAILTLAGVTLLLYVLVNILERTLVHWEDERIVQ
ncbi:MAG: ABC transporter permease [Chloroflexaceae bacterium]|nr:ABC transporter permease [Chloroflexaceae bacterium]NJO06791.1 ABC transporter permease [Chloroflexaceae bacterium]